MDCGKATNNEVELHALKHGLEIMIQEKFMSIQIEGDSKLVVDMVRQLQHKKPMEKISKSWQITWLISEVGKLLTRIEYLIPTHVKRLGNQLADWSANWGSRNRGKLIGSGGMELLLPEEREQLQKLLDTDKGGHDNSEDNGQEKVVSGRCVERSQQVVTDRIIVGKDRGGASDGVGQLTG